MKTNRMKISKRSLLSLLDVNVSLMERHDLLILLNLLIQKVHFHQLVGDKEDGGLLCLQVVDVGDVAGDQPLT